jgi:hypothetical protein
MPICLTDVVFKPMTTKGQIIVAKAVELLRQNPHGLRYSDLLRRIHEALPDANPNMIAGTILTLEVQVPDEVIKPARGLYLHASYREPTIEPSAVREAPPAEKIREAQFYEPFADWLVQELEECTKAIPVGGAIFKDKWGTPDVVGIREPKKSDIVIFPTEIVSAEVKIDSAGLITAFGQACAYRLFSHKSYIVVPDDSPEDDIGRLDTLGRIFGIGLILFNAKDPLNPSFDIRVRAAKHEPDMFYVNQCMRLIEDQLFG